MYLKAPYEKFSIFAKEYLIHIYRFDLLPSPLADGAPYRFYRENSYPLVALVNKWSISYVSWRAPNKCTSEGVIALTLNFEPRALTR